MKGEGGVGVGGREGSQWMGNSGGRTVGKAQVNGECRGDGEGSKDKKEKLDGEGTGREEQRRGRREGAKGRWRVGARRRW